MELILSASDPRLESGTGGLLTRLRARDPGALAALYDEHAASIHGLARRIVRDAEEAEEVAQDVFLYVWRNAARFDPARGSFGAWLTTLTRSRAIDRLRMLDSRVRRTQGLAGQQAARLGVDVDVENPHHQLERAERAARVRRALATLSPDQRQALEIAYFEGLSYSDVAARLATPLGTVKTRIRAGMIQLRRELERSEAPAGRSAARGTAADAS